MFRILVFSIVFCQSCGGEPGDGELIQAAENATIILNEFHDAYESTKTPAECVETLRKYTDRWKTTVTPLQAAGLQKKGAVSELVVNQRFEERYPEKARRFRNAFLRVKDLGLRKAEFCRSHKDYSAVQETAWRTFLGLREKK